MIQSDRPNQTFTVYRSIKTSFTIGHKLKVNTSTATSTFTKLKQSLMTSWHAMDLNCTSRLLWKVTFPFIVLSKCQALNILTILSYNKETTD